MSRDFKEITNPHNDLNILSGIVALLEGGTIYSRTGKTTSARIIKICESAQIRLLREYDRALAKASSQELSE